MLSSLVEETVFVGTTAGQVLKYTVAFSTGRDGKPAFSISSITTRALTSRQAPVQRICAVMSVLRVFVLCERSLTHLDAVTLDDPVPCISGVDKFCLDELSLAPDAYVAETLALRSVLTEPGFLVCASCAVRRLLLAG